MPGPDTATPTIEDTEEGRAGKAAFVASAQRYAHQAGLFGAPFRDTVGALLLTGLREQAPAETVALAT